MFASGVRVAYDRNVSLKTINCVVFIIRKFIIISHKRHNQNKADSTVNKNRDLLNLLVQSGIYELRTLPVAMVPCLLGFNFIDHADFVIYVTIWP